MDYTLRVPSGSVTVLMPVRALVVDIITGDLPSGELASIRSEPCLSRLKLAEPAFDKPRRINLLFGVDVIPKIQTGNIVFLTDRLLSISETLY